jgi:molybdenum cofactor sulfurtransferase
MAEITTTGPPAETMNDPMAYNNYIEDMRETQYPMLKDATYLDHAGTTLYSKALMERFHADMMDNLYGNPHSASPSSQQSTQSVEDARLELLRFLKADPEEYDLVFTANATAAIKLVLVWLPRGCAYELGGRKGICTGTSVLWL